MPSTGMSYSSCCRLRLMIHLYFSSQKRQVYDPEFSCAVLTVHCYSTDCYQWRGMSSFAATVRSPAIGCYFQWTMTHLKSSIVSACCLQVYPCHSSPSLKMWLHLTSFSFYCSCRSLRQPQQMRFSTSFSAIRPSIGYIGPHFDTNSASNHLPTRTSATKHCWAARVIPAQCWRYWSPQSWD